MRKILAVTLIAVVLGMGLVMALRRGPAPVAGDTALSSQETTVPQPSPSAADSPASVAAGAPQNGSASATLAAQPPKAEESEKEKTGQCMLHGTVAYPDGRKAPDCTVRIAAFRSERSGETSVGSRHQETQTDAAGVFEIGGLPSGGYLVTAYTEDGLTTDTIGFGRDLTRREVYLELEPAGAIAGTVKDKAGDPVEGALVYPYKLRADEDPLEAHWSSALAGETGPDGAFRIAALNTGEWQLYAKATGHASTITDYVSTGDTNVTIALGAAGALSGKVVRSGGNEGVSGVTVSLTAEGYYKDYLKAVSDAEGRFRFEGVTPTRYTASIRDTNLVLDGHGPSVEVRANEESSDLIVPVTLGGVVLGRVTNAVTGAGVPDVEITMATLSSALQGSASSPPAILSEGTKTEPDGTFRASGLPTGTYSFSAYHAKGYQGQHAGSVTQTASVKAGEEVSGLTIALTPGIPVSGVVLDEAGNPVKDAEVTGTMEKGADSAVSTADGGFVLTRLGTTEQLFLRARTKDLASNRVGPLTIPESGLTDVELRMRPATGVIAGRLVTASGRPVPNARVSAGLEDMGGGDETSAEGYFRIVGLPEGTYRMSVRIRGGSGMQAELTTIDLAEGQELNDVELVLDSGRIALAGRVTDINGKPLPSAHVEALGPATLRGATGADGTYVLFSEAPGQYRVQATCEGYSAEVIDAVASGTEGVDFALAPGGVLEGRVLRGDSSAPVTDFALEVVLVQSATSMFGGSQGRRRFSDPGGRFRLDGLPEGVITLDAQADGYSPQHVSFDIVSGQTTTDAEIVLEPSATVEGSVRTATGQPVAGAVILAGRVDSGPVGWGGCPRLGVSAGDGTFRVNALPADTQRIGAMHPDYAVGYVDVDPLSNQKIRADIVLQPAAALEGTVTVNGRPAPNAHLTLFYVEAAHRGQLDASTGPAGEYRFDGVSPGQVMLTVQTGSSGDWSPRRIVRSAVLKTGAVERVDFDLVGNDAALEGKVTLGGQQASSVRTLLVHNYPDGSRETLEGMSEGGGYRLDGAPEGPGLLTVQGYSADGRNVVQTVPVNLSRGRATRRDVDLAGNNVITGTVQGWQEGMTGVVALLVGTDRSAAFRELNGYSHLWQSATVGPVESSFRFENLGDGTYTIVVSLQDMSPDGRDPNLRARKGSVETTVRGGGTTNIQVVVD